MISITELNTNPIYKPPQQWLDDIEKEEQQIKNSFFSNNFDVWEIIRNFKEAKENEDWSVKMWNDYNNINQDASLSNGWWGNKIRAMGFKCVPSQWDIEYRIKFCRRYTTYKNIINNPKKVKINNWDDCYKILSQYKNMVTMMEFNHCEFDFFKSNEKNIKKYFKDYYLLDYAY